MSKIYDDFAPAESAVEMLEDVAMKEVKDGYIIVTNLTLKVIGDFTLDDKADVVLMMPLEGLLDAIPISAEYAIRRHATWDNPWKGRHPSQEACEGPWVFIVSVYFVTVRGPSL